MEIHLLGPFCLTYGQASAVPTAPKSRKVLALLATNADQVISVGSLLEELWGEHPPARAMTTIQTYIMQLRSLIAIALPGTHAEALADAKQILSTEGAGYRLNARKAAVDARQYDLLAADGYRSMSSGDYAAASEKFRQALALWCGPALVDVDIGPLLQAQVQRLEESRLSCLSQRIDADLRLGRHHEIIGELAALSVRYPTNEVFQFQYMLALGRVGRRSAALETYQRLRTQLRRELLLEPSAPVRELQQALLTGAHGLDIGTEMTEWLRGELVVLRAG